MATFISSSVAGREGSMTADKLLFLYTVGSGFSPLIYKLTKNASCQKLRELCKTVWMELEMTPYLPELLVINFVLIKWLNPLLMPCA